MTEIEDGHDRARGSARFGKGGLTRREMIRASAIAGAAAWTAPVIVDSLTSPAAASSVPLATGISHIDIVFQAGAGAPCSLTSGTYYELFWNLSGWAGPGGGSRCADGDDLFTCDGGVSDGPMCLITALNAISGLVTTDECGCIELHTNKLPTGVTACINHSRTFCGHTTFNVNGIPDNNGPNTKCAMPCSNSTSTIIKFCCEPNACCPSSVPAACTC